MFEHSYCNTVLFERKSVFVTSTSGFSLMHATSIKPVGVGLVFSALICAGFCHRKERERNGRGQQSCDIDYEEEKNSKQQNAQSIKRTVPRRNRRRGYFPRTNRTNSATFSCRTRSCTRSQFLQSLIQDKTSAKVTAARFDAKNGRDPRTPKTKQKDLLRGDGDGKDTSRTH